MRRSATRVTGNAGFTLVEFMIVMVILGVVVAALVGTLNKQQRFYHGARELLDTRTHLREAGAVLLTDLRTITPAGNDVYAWADKRIQFRMTTGSTIACRIVTAANQIVVPPVNVSRGNTLSSWLTAPVGGDSILIYDEGFDVSADDDFWRAYRIMGVASVNGPNGCPTGAFGGGGYMEAADAATPSTQLTLSAAIPASIARGAPVRIFRRAEYGLYQSTTDSKWYLGFFDCLPTRVPNCTNYAPVSGPYRPYSSANPGASGLSFTYFDSLGTVLDPATGNRTQIARIGITARTLTESQLSLAGGAGNRTADSLSFIVGLRNRR
jgi:prepilin-type N-terminal cleavage/methylation domain-containing protein